ncbi:hypothetical protein AZE42_06420 [Rhizopogon vesiculosus]|uniref:Uncharacterized protein n=1 Tax=Rhizopogon vesiculosus TaxID=180088 RepID=A0A1J8PNJ7_9AGAM|nr:hypothetical protein AZE42_06420 [Rhizopogon vesiculosus]
MTQQACIAVLDVKRHFTRAVRSSAVAVDGLLSLMPGAVNQQEEGSRVRPMTEIICTICGGHLEHVFKGEGFDTPSVPILIFRGLDLDLTISPADERHCVNLILLNLKDDSE